MTGADALPWGLGIGAGVGLLDFISGQNAANRQRDLASKTAAYSPWTGLKPQPVQDPSMMGDLVAGAAAGGGVSTGIAQMNLDDAMAKRLTNGGSLLGYGNPMTEKAAGAHWSTPSLGADAPPDSMKGFNSTPSLGGNSYSGWADGSGDKPSGYWDPQYKGSVLKPSTPGGVTNPAGLWYANDPKSPYYNPTWAGMGG